MHDVMASLFDPGKDQAYPLVTSTKDPEVESVLKEEKGTEESPPAHMGEEIEEQTSASPSVSHTEPNLVYDNITGERSDNHHTFIKQ